MSSQRVGRFEVRALIAKGPRTAVYRGVDPDTQRPVAVKVIPRAHLDAAALPAFRKQAQALARLDHPGVAAFVELVENEKAACVVTELCEGAPLSGLLKEGAHPEMRDVWNIARALLEALAFAHAKGAVHRDLKPGDVMLAPGGGLKVIDFCTAMLVAGPRQEVRYLAPEQFAGGTVNARTDLYQAGVIVYQLVTGRLPFTGTPQEIEHLVHQERPSDPSSYNRRIAWQLDWVIQKALSKDPAERFASAIDFAEGLRLGLQDTVGRPLDPIAPAAATAPPPAAPRTPVTPPVAPFAAPAATSNKPAAAPAADPKPAAAPAADPKPAAAPAADPKPAASGSKPATAPAPHAKPAAAPTAPAMATPVATPAATRTDAAPPHVTAPPPATAKPAAAAVPAASAPAAAAPAAASLARNAQAIARPAAGDPRTAPAAAEAKPRILFVDDDERILNALRALFRQDYQVFTAAGGAAALEVVKTQLVHVVVSDQRMPQMSGVELLRRVRVAAPDAVRILLTGYTDLAALVGSINEGEIFRFVRKPWDNDELRQALSDASKIALELAGTPTPRALSPRSAGSLLVIDPREGLGRGLERLLAGAAKVRQVPGPAEAAQVLKGEEVAAIVADLGAGMDGLVALFRKVKAQRPEVLSILLADEPDSELGIELVNKAQIFRFLPKPVSARELRAHVAAALRRYAAFKQVPTLADALPADAPRGSAAAERARALPGRSLARSA